MLRARGSRNLEQPSCVVKGATESKSHACDRAIQVEPAGADVHAPKRSARRSCAANSNAVPPKKGPGDAGPLALVQSPSLMWWQRTKQCTSVDVREANAVRDPPTCRDTHKPLQMPLQYTSVPACATTPTEVHVHSVVATRRGDWRSMGWWEDELHTFGSFRKTDKNNQKQCRHVQPPTYAIRGKGTAPEENEMSTDCCTIYVTGTPPK